MNRFLFFTFTSLCISLSSYAQKVGDNKPVFVTIAVDQILRLSINSGGNLEFVFNNMAQYQNGINSGGVTASYNTVFSVTSSTHWDLFMGAEDATFQSTDYFSPPVGSPVGALSLDNVGYNFTHVPGNPNADFATPAAGFPSTVQKLQVFGGASVIASSVTGNPGDASANTFTIQWRVGTKEGTMNVKSILAQNVNPDRYITNVILEVAKGLL